LVIGEPPSFCGADQKMVICVGEIAVAVAPAGGSDTVAALALFTDNKMRDTENTASRYFIIFKSRKDLLISS